MLRLCAPMIATVQRPPLWHRNWSEIVNAATMVPGIILAVVRLRAVLAKRTTGLRATLDRTQRPLAVAVASFVPLCAVSILHHLVDGAAQPGLKARSLRADYTMQQISAVMHAVATHTASVHKRRAAVAAVVVLSGATWVFDVANNKGQTAVLALQTTIVGIACAFRVSRWWVAALAARVGSSYATTLGRGTDTRGGGSHVPLRLLHGAFHILVIAAFSDLWKSLDNGRRTPVS